MMSTFLRWSAIPLILAVTFGCATQLRIDELEPDTAFEKLMNLYNRGKYIPAAEGFEYYTLNFAGSAKVDSAQLMLGWSHFHLKEYILAADAFEQLTRRFPNSAQVPEAMYMIGECYWKLSPRPSLDQGYTRRAIEALQAFIDTFPDRRELTAKAAATIGLCRDKLARKSFTNGVLYSKMKEWDAAVIYFRLVIDEFYDTQWAAPAMFELGRAQIALGDAAAAETLQEFLKKYPDHHLAPKVKISLDNLGAGAAAAVRSEKGE